MILLFESVCILMLDWITTVFSYVLLVLKFSCDLFRVSYLVVTAGLLTLGAVSLNWICDKITEAGFGESLSNLL